VALELYQCCRWWTAKNPPYKHTIGAYTAAMAGIRSQFDYDNCQKNCHVISP